MFDFIVLFDGEVTFCRTQDCFFNVIWEDTEEGIDTGLCIWTYIGDDGKYYSSGDCRLF